VDKQSVVLVISDSPKSHGILEGGKYCVRTASPSEGIHALFRLNGSVCAAVIESEDWRIGRDFLVKMREHLFMTPVIVISDAETSEYVDLDVFSHLSHPVDAASLIEAVSICDQTYVRFHHEVHSTTRHIDEMVKDAAVAHVK
jgi:hypothetical protein